MWTEARLGINSASNSVISRLRNPSRTVDASVVSLILSTSDFTKSNYFQNRSFDATAAATGCTFDATVATAAVTGRTVDATAVTAG